MRAVPLQQTGVVSIRDAGEADHGRILEIGNTLFPEDYQETPEEFHHYREHLRAGGHADVFAVAEASGGIVGYAHHQQMPGQTDRDRYRVIIGVAPAWRGRGVGGTLYAHLDAALHARGAQVAESFARETDAYVIGFLARRGFHEVMRVWEMRLNPSRFDPAPFSDYLERVRRAGVVITTLAAERARDPNAARKAYELHNDVDADIPSTSPFQRPAFERYLEHNVDGPNAVLDAYFIAKIGDEYVGESILRKPGTGAYLLVNTTGVRQPYRGRGIAMALKLATIDYARTHESPQIRTWNEINNAGMLAINERLGFVRTPAWITYEKRFAPGERPASEPEGGPR